MLSDLGVGIFIKSLIMSIELPQSLGKEVYLTVIRMKYILDTWDVIRVFAEGIYIFPEFILHILLGKWIVSSGYIGQQLIIEVRRTFLISPLGIRSVAYLPSFAT